MSSVCFPFVATLGQTNHHKPMSIQLNKRFDVSGHLVSGSLDEMQQFRDRMCGCYQIILQPFDPMLQFELDQILELAAGPEPVLDTTEIYTRDKDLILETVVKPYAPDFPNQNEPMPGTSIKVTVFPELKYSPDHSIAYPQLTIVGVDKYRDPSDDIDWDSMPDNGYNF